jgi:hypothetical protein
MYVRRLVNAVGGRLAPAASLSAVKKKKKKINDSLNSMVAPRAKPAVITSYKRVQHSVVGGGGEDYLALRFLRARQNNPNERYRRMRLWRVCNGAARVGNGCTSFARLCSGKGRRLVCRASSVPSSVVASLVSRASATRASTIGGGMLVAFCVALPFCAVA